MTIEEAIKALTRYKVEGELPCSISLDDALQLGIEALKVWNLYRQGKSLTGIWLLPGETEK